MHTSSRRPSSKQDRRGGEVAAHAFEKGDALRRPHPFSCVLLAVKAEESQLVHQRVAVTKELQIPPPGQSDQQLHLQVGMNTTDNGDQ